MKKLGTIVFLLLSIVVFAQNHLSRSPNTGSLQFSGFIGHKGQVPTGEMADSIGIDKLKEICHFFAGDTLDGFDFEKYSSETFVAGVRLLSEYKNSMRNYQIQFVKNKLDLKSIPKFEKKSIYKKPEYPSTLSSGCNNLDFEDGNLNSWNVTSGVNQNSNAPLTLLGAGFVSTNEDIYSCNDVNLINNLYGSDVLGLPGLDPFGGSTSIRLGGYSINLSGSYGSCPANTYWDATYSNGEMISKTIVVTAANALMAYDYEVVLNDGGHPNGQQPYFHVIITNLAGTVLSNCTEYYVQAIAGSLPSGFANSGFVNSIDNSIIYTKPWTSNSINLTPYIGQTVFVSFVSAGCTLGAHFAYAYVDAFCGPVEIIASDTAPCAGTTVTLTAPSVVYGTYSWSGPGIVGSTTNQIATINASGTYTVTITPAQGVTCAYTINKLINFRPLPIASITAVPPTICASGISALNASITGGSGVYPSILWSGAGAGSLSATNIVNPTFTNSVAGSYPLTFSVTDNQGCVGVSNTTITVNANPTPTITASGPITFCAGGSVNLDAGSGYSSYTWSNGATSQTVNITTSGSYSVSVTDANGCTGSSASNTTVVVNSNPIPTITASPSSICANGTSALNVSITGGSGSNSSTIWTGAGAGSLSATTILNPTFTNSVAGSYPLTFTVTDDQGCTGVSNTTITVNVNLIPTITVTGPTTFCSGGSVTLDAGSGYSTYLWSNGATSQTVNITSSGSYSVTVTDPNGCNGSSASSTAITVNPSPLPTIAANGTTTFCSGGQVVLDAGTGYTTYSWSNGPSSQTINVTSTGTYIVTVEDANGCVGSSSMAITVNSLPVADTLAIAISTDNCGDTIGAIAGIVMTTGLAPFQYIWQNAIGTIVGTTANVSNLPGGIYTLTVTDGNGCSTVAGSFPVSSTPSVTALFTADPLSGETPLPVNFTNASIGATNYLWEFGTGDTSVSVNPTYIYMPLGDFNVCLIANNAYACYDTVCAAIDIFINSVFIIPNIFTPNNDEVNDVFKIKTKGLKTLDAEIYNRWGQKLYEWHTINGGWNGYSASGVPASDGTYYFIINANGIDGKKYFQKGSFSLIR